MSKCAKILARRWAVLTFVVSQIAYGIMWLLNGSVPVAREFKSGPPDTYEQLPVVLPRLVDAFVLVIPVTIVTWFIVDCERILRWWFRDTPKYLRPADREADLIALNVCGAVVVGLIGSGIIVGTGWNGLIIGSLIGGVVYVLEGASDRLKPVVSFGLELITALTIWTVLTLIKGTVIGFAAAVACLAVSATVHFGPYLLGLGIYRLCTRNYVRSGSSSFAKFMTECELPDG